MTSEAKVPMMFETDWGWGSWTVGIAVLVLAAFAVVVSLVLTSRVRDVAWIPGAGGGVAALVLTATAHTVARHLESGRGAGALLFGLFLVGLGLSVYYLAADFNIASAVVSVALGGSALFWAVAEGLTRAAASVPMTVPALVILAIAAFAYFALSARSQS